MKTKVEILDENDEVVERGYIDGYVFMSNTSDCVAIVVVGNKIYTASLDSLRVIDEDLTSTGFVSFETT